MLNLLCKFHLNGIIFATIYKVKNIVLYKYIKYKLNSIYANIS
jgi:hypothetical protein